MKKISILFSSMFIMSLFLIPTNASHAQSAQFINKWHIGLTADYHRPIWTKDFQNFLNQNQSHLCTMAGTETFGWEIGMPIPTTDHMKIIASASTSYNSLLLAQSVGSVARYSNSALSVQNVDAAVRYILPFSMENNVFSVDLGVGYQTYAFAYYDQLPTGNLAIENMDDIFATTTQAVEVKQQLWAIRAAFNYEFKISKHLYVDVSLSYGVMMSDNTFINDTRTMIDNFPTMSNHSFAMSLGLNYYFNNL